MNKPEIIFYDLDGTSLNFCKRFSKKTIEYFNQVSQEIMMIPCTGRGNVPSTHEIFKSVDAHTYILGNGSQIFHNDELIFQASIDYHILFDLLQVLKKYKYTIIVNSELHTKTFSTSRIIRNLARIFANVQKHSIESFRALIQSENQIFKILLIPLKRKQRAEIQKQIKEKLPSTINIAATGHNHSYFEITAQNATKGKAIKFLSEYLNKDLAKTVHFGDSMNDASAKGYVNKLYAMKNASQNLKNIADEVIPYKSRKAGLGRFLVEKFCKIKSPKE